MMRGGHVDLCVLGAFQVAVNGTKGGEPKIVAACSYPLTGLACVKRIYADLAVIEVAGGGGLRVLDRAPGVSLDALRACTAGELIG
jgi:acyl CoA:acetate/3-ketoacid CoA transferase beta subunit